MSQTQQGRPPGALATITESPSKTVARLALTKAEAAASIGVSVDFLEQHVIHELRVVRRGRRVLIAVRELDRWLETNASRTLP
jgi:excisionase family DNA binding protein